MENSPEPDDEQDMVELPEMAGIPELLGSESQFFKDSAACDNRQRK